MEHGAYFDLLALTHVRQLSNRGVFELHAEVYYLWQEKTPAASNKVPIARSYSGNKQKLRVLSFFR